MSSNTKDRLLNDLEALRQQLAQIEAYGAGEESDAAIPTLEVDNIPLLGDAVPADREEAILAHREAMAQLDAELKELDKKSKSAATSELHPALSPTETTDVTSAQLATPASHQVSSLADSDTAPPQVFAAKEDLKIPNASMEVLAKLTQPKHAYTDFSLEDTGPREAIHTSQLPPSFSNPTTMNNKAAPTAMTSPAKTSDENPFLPQHLRERLDKSKTSLLQEIARSSESLDASTALLRNFGGADYVKNLAPVIPASTDPNNHQALVDTLVAKYLPLIEADLRQRLNTAVQQQLAPTLKNKKALEPSH